MRILLRAAPDLDLWGEFSTEAEGFVAAGSEAELRARTEHPAEDWERARTTGSSAARGDGAFADAGLIVQDAAPVGQRWLPRAHVGDYLDALLADDRERVFQLTQAFDDEPAVTLERFPIGSEVIVLPDRRNAAWIRGQVRAGLDVGELPGGGTIGELLVKLSTNGEVRWFGNDQVIEPRYFSGSSTTTAEQAAATPRAFNVRAATPRRADPEELLLLVDHIPTWQEMRWRERDGHYVAELDGVVRHLHASADGGGYYGATFDLTMEDGARRTLVGPYTSGSWFLNEAFPELGGVVEATATDSAYTLWSRGSGEAIQLTRARLAEIHTQFPELAEQQQSAIAARDRRRADRARAVQNTGDSPPATPPPNRPAPGRQP
jgi:hypothetical protein